MLSLQCKMLQGSDLRSLLTWVITLRWGLLMQALPLQVFLMTLFRSSHHLVICFSKSSSWHSHWWACQLWALPLLVLGSCPAFQGWAHWQCITALCWRSTELGQASPGPQLFVRNAGVMAKLITSEPSRANSPRTVYSSSPCSTT